MTRDAFERCLIRFGADLAHWPAAARAAAEALLARDREARALLAADAALDRRIVRAAATRTTDDTAPARRISTALSGAPLPRQSHRHPVLWLPGWLIALDLRPAWPSIAALAGMALLGFVVGSNDALIGAGAARGLSTTDVSAVVFEPGPIGEGVL